LFQGVPIAQPPVGNRRFKLPEPPQPWEDNSSCPVIFYIHGGSLNYDSAVMFDDQYITDKYSSKDIIAGLEYIHHEISAFGGDPKQVTLMGHSQGGSIAMIFAASR
ncbi:hypothetical protein ANCDUO_19433, partial [Ancylostoma duodenale]